jgi:exopolysaccharide production protein ExoQ
MAGSFQNTAALRRNFPQVSKASALGQRLRKAIPAMPKRETKGLMLTASFCLLVWSGYNTAIYYFMDPLFPKSFVSFVHGVRAFFPIAAGVIAAGQLARHRSVPPWLAFGPLFLLLFYGGIGLASSIFCSSQPVPAAYWALEYISVIVVVMAVASSPEPEKHLARYISVNWVCCAAICIGLLLGIPLLGGGALGQTAGSPLGVMAYGEVKDVLGMAGTRNTGFGRFAGIVILVGIAKLLHDRRDKKTLFIWTPLTLVAGLALTLSQARTSWVSVVVAAAMLLARAPTRWRIPLIMLALLALPLFWLSGFGQGFLLYLTRGKGIDPTLTGRTATWAQGWDALQQSPLVGLGFWADRYFLRGANIQNTFFDALMQSGFLGLIPLVIALVWVWIGIMRLNATKAFAETSSLPAELLGVMAFLTVYSLTEVTYSFYSVGWIVMAPLFAYVQLRVHHFDRAKANPAFAPTWMQNVRATRAVVAGRRIIQGS